MYNIWDFGVNNTYFQIFHHLFIRLGVSPILQVRKTRLREVNVGTINVWWTRRWTVLQLKFKTRLAWPHMYILSPLYGRLGFLLLCQQLLLQSRAGQPNYSIGPGTGKSWVYQNGSVSLLRGKAPTTLNSVCMDQREQKLIVPSVDKTMLLDFKESQLRRASSPGARREMEMEALALPSVASGCGAGAAHSRCLSSQRTALWIGGASCPNPQLPLRPNTPKAQFLFEVDVLLFTRRKGIRGSAPHPHRRGKGHLSLSQQGALSAAPGDNGIGAFPQGSLGPPGILIKVALWALGGKHGPRTPHVGACFEVWFCSVLKEARFTAAQEMEKWTNGLKLNPKARASMLKTMFKTLPLSFLFSGVEMSRKPYWKLLIVSWFGVMLFLFLLSESILKKKVTNSSVRWLVTFNYIY